MEAPSVTANENESLTKINSLPLDVLRMSALNFTWATLNKTWNSEELKSICNDPKFWFEKLRNEKLVLNDPIVIDWIKIWIGTPLQTKLLTSLDEKQSFHLHILHQLIDDVYRSTFRPISYDGNDEQKVNSSSLLDLSKQTTETRRVLFSQLEIIFGLESVQINLNEANSILQRRKRKLEDSFRKAKPELANDYLVFTLPPLNMKNNNFSFQDYLNKLKLSNITMSYFIDFLGDSVIIEIFNEISLEDLAEVINDYFDNNPRQYQLHREMIEKKAELIGSHLKTGDIVSIGDDEYFVTKEDNKVLLHFFDGLLPQAALSVLLKHKVQTRSELVVLYSDVESIQTDCGTLTFSNKKSKANTQLIQQQTFFGTLIENTKKTTKKGKQIDSDSDEEPAPLKRQILSKKLSAVNSDDSSSESEEDFNSGKSTAPYAFEQFKDKLFINKARGWVAKRDPSRPNAIVIVGEIDKENKVHPLSKRSQMMARSLGIKYEGDFKPEP